MASPPRLPGGGPWPHGINNLAPEGGLPTDEDGRPVALQEADNVDLSKEGRASRRDGFASAVPGVLCHSLWSHDDLDFGLFVDNGQLMAFDPPTAGELLGMEVGNMPLSYDIAGDRVFFSSRSTCGMLLAADRTVHAWAAPATPPVPLLELLDGFALPAGLYQLAITVTDSLGRESGAGLARQLQVQEAAGILLQGLPAITAGTVNVYLTGPNDQVLRLAVRLPAGTPSYLLASVPEGIKLATQLLDPMPPGQLTRIHNGRHWVASGRVLRWSPSLRYGMTDLAHNQIRFDANIDLLEPVGAGTPSAGMFIAAGKRTYWLAGSDPSAFSPVGAHSAGAVPGTETRVPGQALGLDTDADVTVWLSRHGRYVVGLPGGAVNGLNPHAAVSDAASGASVFTEREGRRQLITAVRGARPQGLAITDRAVAHVIYDGS